MVFAGLLDGLGNGSSLRGGSIFLVISDGHSIGAVEGLSVGSSLVRIGPNVGCLWIVLVSYPFGPGEEVYMCIPDSSSWLARGCLLISTVWYTFGPGDEVSMCGPA